MQQSRRPHLSSSEMHAPSAHEVRCMHLLAPKDACIQHGARASGGDTRLLLSNSSATGGSNPLRTNAGGSVLPETDFGGSTLSEVKVGGSISPRTYEHVRSAQQEPSTRRKGRPKRRKSSRT